MKIPKIRANAVVFDYGNTLVLSPLEEVLDAKAAEFQKELKIRGYDIPGDKIIDAWTKADEEITYVHISHFGQEEPIIIEALRKLGISHDLEAISKRLLEIYRKGYEEFCLNDPRKPEIKEVLEFLKQKGKKLGIFSDGRKYDLSLAMRAYGISKYFDFMLASEETGFEKPHASVAKIIMQKTGETAENIAYVGDNSTRDSFSKEAGMKFILFVPPPKYGKSVPWRNYGEKSRHEPDAVIKNLLELKNILI